MTDTALQDLAAEAGLSARWIDYRGEARQVEESALKYTLGCLGFSVGSATQIEESRAQLRVESASGNELLLTVDCEASLPLPLLFPGQGLRWLHEDSGEDTAAQTRGSPIAVIAPSKPGYYLLTDGSRARRVAVAPRRAMPETFRNGHRWGLSAQIYSLPRAGDAGIGDFSSLKQLAIWAAAEGADALAMSPAHALFGSDLNRYSPYSPSSRLFLNVLYGDPAGLIDGAVRSAQSAPDSALIDWPAASALRIAALKQSFEAVRPLLQTNHPLSEQFSNFVREGGPRLIDHARFEVLSAHSVAQGGAPTWREWPQQFRHPASPAVAEFCEAHIDQMQYQLFAQWVADRSLGDAQNAAREHGMALGLIGDLAVGTDSGGSHAWSLQDGMLRGLSVGAPPDLMAGQGQNWGLTTFSPRELKNTGFAPFIELLRANLKRVGGLRIDHILGLRRLWLAPDGAPASQGVYLDYPLDDLLRLIRLESGRHQALVIGEDLGTVPPGFRDQMRENDVLGMQVLWFERDHGFFVEPSRWSTTAMATTTTHDVPPVAGWWQGRDLDWRLHAGQFATGSSEQGERAARVEERRLLWGALQHQQLVTGEPPMPDNGEAVVDAAISFVASTPAPLVMVPMEDLLGLVEAPNVPGTMDEHPNWRRRLPIAMQALAGDTAATRRTAVLRTRRPRP